MHNRKLSKIKHGMIWETTNACKENMDLSMLQYRKV